MPPLPTAPDARDETAAVRDAVAGGTEKRAYVRRVFSEIAPRYDLLNHLLSLNIDVRWRRRAIAALGWQRQPAGVYVDACAGTLDLGVELAVQPGFRGTVVAADFAEPMLRAGRAKLAGRAVVPVVADALALPLRARTAAGLAVAFGVRNVADLDAAIREAYRVLAPGARFVILEFSTPRQPVARALYHAYFRHLLPTVGRLVSGHATAYDYLPASVAAFPAEEALAERMTRAGFERVRWESLTLGIAAIHVGEKPSTPDEQP
jgi:demethylmenaquinone methyltransferase/2-methoxy-6-polyprenyl-1,4-benzoquinol methylase